MKTSDEKMHLMTLIIFFYAPLTSVESGKILMFPSSFNSHVIVYSKLGMGLADEGHEVQLLLSSSIKMPTHTYRSNASSGTFGYIVYNASVEKPFSNSENMSKAIVDVAMAESAWQRFWKAIKMQSDTKNRYEADCLDMLRDKELMKNLSKSGFQFAIVDFVVVECSYILPIYLDIPYAAYSIPWLAWLYRVPRLQSFTPLFGDNNSNEMSFYQRLSTLLREVIYMYLCQSFNDFSREFLPPDSQRWSTLKLLESANLWIFLEDLSVSYPNANMPNTVSVGDIMIDNDVKSLPDNLEEFIGGKDVAIVSFGSFFDFVPDFVIKRFCESFKHFSGKLKFIWKLNKHLDGACPCSDNILILNWLPQNDLLAHPKVKFFINHGGLNSIIESVNHKKPMIILPLVFDQQHNAAVARSKGYAIIMSLPSFTVDELVKGIDDILNNPTYSEKVRFYSQILKDKPDRPGQRVSRLVEHILKYGDEHLRTSAYKLTPLQFLMADVIAFLTVVFIFLLLCVKSVLDRGLTFIRKNVKQVPKDVMKKGQ